MKMKEFSSKVRGCSNTTKLPFPLARMGFADDAYQPFGWVGDTMGMGMDKVSTRTVISFARCHHEGGTPQINKRKIT